MSRMRRQKAAATDAPFSMTASWRSQWLCRKRWAVPAKGATAIHEYEPGEDEVLGFLLSRNISTQIFRGLLENAASEQGARMSAMDSATRNAGDMINKLTIQYNRSRQAAITTELIEIIAGAEAL